MYTKTSFPVARKEHQCMVCSSQIPIGDQYCNSTTFDNDMMVWKACLLCEQGATKAQDAGFGDYNGFITSEDILEWADEYKSLDRTAHEITTTLGEYQ